MKPKIDAKQALVDIRTGMDDQTLMDKYSISARGLQSLFRKLVTAGIITQEEIDQRTSHSFGSVSIADDVRKSVAELKKPRGRIVNAHDVARDIRAGMSDADLMETYRLSSKGLQSLFEQLVNADVVSQIEIDQRMPWTDSTVDVLGILKRFGLDQSAPAEGGSGVPSRCVACGAHQTMEFDVCPVCGTNIPEFKAKRAKGKHTDKDVWVCPACKKPQAEAHEECPVCGIIVSKYKERQ